MSKTIEELLAPLPPIKVEQLRAQVDWLLAENASSPREEYLIALLINWGCTARAMARRVGQLEQELENEIVGQA